VAQHQSNHARILELRQTADALDGQIKTSISLLAETRKELLSTPFIDSTTTSRDVPFDELLAYAKRISRYTVPATYRPAPPKAPEETIKASIETEDVAMSNGAATSPAPVAMETEAQVPAHLSEESQGKGYAALSPEQKEWMDRMAKEPFIPWPSEANMKLGALEAVKTMLQQGVDPTAVLGPEEQEEKDRRDREESEQRRTEILEAAKRRRLSNSGGRASGPQIQEQPAFEGFELYNPEEEEE
jgi:hypothetical protein